MKNLNVKIKEKIALKAANFFTHQAEVSTRGCSGPILSEPKFPVELLKKQSEKNL